MKSIKNLVHNIFVEIMLILSKADRLEFTKLSTVNILLDKDYDYKIWLIIIIL